MKGEWLLDLPRKRSQASAGLWHQITPHTANYILITRISPWEGGGEEKCGFSGPLEAPNGSHTRTGLLQQFWGYNKPDNTGTGSKIHLLMFRTIRSR